MNSYTFEITAAVVKNRTLLNLVRNTLRLKGGIRDRLVFGKNNLDHMSVR